MNLRIAGQLISVGLLSFLSGYSWPALHDVNFDIVNMLTPLGIVQNLSDPASPLHKYYFIPDGADGPSWLAVFVIVVLIVHGMLLLEKLGREE